MNKQQALYWMWGENVNPRGDIDADNAPTQMPDGRGYVTDVAIKAKIREIVSTESPEVRKWLHEVAGMGPDDNYRIWESKKKGFQHVTTTKEALYEVKKMGLTHNEKLLMERYVDIRWFGVVAQESTKGKKDKKDKKDNDEVAEDKGNGIHFKRTGALQMSAAISIDPVEIVDLSLLNRFTLEPDKESNLAPSADKRIVSGLYVGSYHVNPHYAYENVLGGDDIKLFRRVLKESFDLTMSRIRTSIRPMSVIGGIHVTHGGPTATENWNDIVREMMPKRCKGTGSPSGPEDYQFANIADLQAKFPNVKFEELV